MADDKKETQTDQSDYQVEVALDYQLDEIEPVVGERVEELGADAAVRGDAAGSAFVDAGVSIQAGSDALSAHESAHTVNAAVSELERGVRETASQASAAIHNTAASLAQPSSTVSSGQYQQAVQNNDEVVAADAVAVEEQKQYDIERAEDQEAKAVEAQREQELAEQERQREEQEAQQRQEQEEREREERERQEREEQEQKEREEAEQHSQDADHYDY